jgi:general secretion pathway protein G
MPAGRSSILQAALYIAVVSVLAVVLLDRMQVYSAFAERATVDVTLNNLRSALYVRLAQDRLQGNLSREHLWDGGNPFELARVTVSNYAGVLAGPEIQSALPEGAWGYDGDRRELIYRPSYPRGLRVEGGGTLLRYRLRVSDSSTLPRFEPVAAFVWEP